MNEEVTRTPPAQEEDKTIGIQYPYKNASVQLRKTHKNIYQTNDARINGPFRIHGWASYR